jgi:hypothetical protein
MNSWTLALADPFLRAHAAGEYLVEIGPQISPLSIRDQMFRGAVCVDRAVEHGLIGGSNNNPLLVVGGGAAGVSAAARARRHGVKVCLVERNEMLFGLQQGCPTRWVSPTQYDWPAPHAGRHTLPWAKEHPEVELSWGEADYADQLAARWSAAWYELQNRAGGLADLLPETEYQGSVRPEWPGRFAKLVNVKDGKEEWRRSSLVILATGLGTEQTSGSDGHRGFGFWSEDPFERDNLGLPAGVTPEVLISGAGDGALQDFIRIATGERSALEVYQGLDIPNDVRAKFELEIAAAEDQFQRAILWSTRAWDCELHRQVQRSYEGAVKALIRGSPRLSLPRRGDIRLTMAYPCDHFGRCYALNRAVALIIARIEENRNLLPFRRLDTITGCSGNCHGQDHVVVTRGWSCAGRKGAARTNHKCNVLVSRHGLREPGARRLETRQMLPYYMPWTPARR